MLITVTSKKTELQACIICSLQTEITEMKVHVFKLDGALEFGEIRVCTKMYQCFELRPSFFWI